MGASQVETSPSEVEEEFKYDADPTISTVGSLPKKKLWLLALTTLISVASSQTHPEKLVILPIGDAISMTIANYPSGGPTTLPGGTACCTAGFSAAKYMLVGAWFKVSCSSSVAIPVMKGDSNQQRYSDLGELEAVVQADYHGSQFRTAPCNTWLGVAFRYLVPTNGILGSTPEAVQYIGPFKDYNPAQAYYIKLEPTVSSGQFVWPTDPAVTIYNQFYYLDYTGQKQYPPTGSSECTQVVNFCTNGVMSAFLQIMSGPINPIPLVNLNLYKYFTNTFYYESNQISGADVLNYINYKGMRMWHDKTYTFPNLISFPNMNGASMTRPCIDVKIALNNGKFSRRDKRIKYHFYIKKGNFKVLEDFKLEFKYWWDDSKVEFSTSLDNIKSKNEWDLSLSTDTNVSQTPTVHFKFCQFPTGLTAYYQIIFGTKAQICTYNPLGHWGQFTDVSNGAVNGYTGGPLDFRIDFENDHDNSYGFYVSSIKVHEGGMFGSMADVKSPATASNLCLESSYTLDPGYSALSYYCLVCASNTVNLNGVCTSFNSPPAGVTFPATSVSSVPEDTTRIATCNSAGYFYNIVSYNCIAKSTCPGDYYFGYGSTHCSPPLAQACGLFSSWNSGTSSCVCNTPNCASCSTATCNQCQPNFYLKIAGSVVSCVSIISTGFGFDTSSGSLQIIRPCAVWGCQDCTYNYLNCYLCSAPVAPNVCTALTTPCPVSCATCKPSNPTQCWTCKAGFLLYPSSSTCAACTAPGFYQTATECLPCNAACATCSGPTNKECITCNAGVYLQLDNGCAPCAIGQTFFIDPANSKCTPCYSGFLTCTSSTQSGGTSCIAGYTFVPGSPPTCTSGCGPSQYLISAPATCGPCMSSCSTCSTGTTCKTCAITSPFYQPWNSTCVVSCVGKTYQVSPTECGLCHSSCGTCTGPLANQCTSCLTNEYLLLTIVTGTTGTCTPCLDPTFTISTMYCQLCAAPCLACSGPTASQCVTCLSTYTLRGPAGGVCVNCDISGSQFINPADDMCYDCDSSKCATCSGSATNCVLCATGLFKYPDGSCGPCTETGYYQYNDGVPRCAQCNIACLECSTTSVNCAVCDTANQYFKIQGTNTCAACDLSNSFIQGTECIRCSQNCMTCSGTSVNCTTCPPKKFLYTNNNTCGDCNNEFGLFKDLLTNKIQPLCTACLPICASCSNTLLCDSCIPGQYLYSNKTCSVCTAQNEAITGTSCVNCDITCLSCKGSSKNDCLSCTFDRYLSTQGECLKRSIITLDSRTFSADILQGSAAFNINIEPAVADLSADTEIEVFAEKEDVVFKAVNNSATSLGSTAGLNKVSGYSVDSIRTSGKYLHVKIKATQTIKDATLVVRFKKIPTIQKLNDKNSIYTGKTITISPVNVIITAMDGALAAASAPVSTAMTTMTTFIFLISIPQAFILMKVFQTIDFYVYVDCDYPSNFSKFLEIISKNIMDYVPNFLQELADEEGTPIYPRFSQFGQNVHVFQNLGPLFTVVCGLVAIKIILFGLSWIFKSNKRFRSKLLSHCRMECQFGCRSLVGDTRSLPHGHLALDRDPHHVPRHGEQLGTQSSLPRHSVCVVARDGSHLPLPSDGLHHQPSDQSLPKLRYPGDQRHER